MIERFQSEKSKWMRYAPVLALLKGEVSSVEASRWLFPKRVFLAEGSVRSYTVGYARMFTTIDKE
jgi:hypothetical protein